MYCPGRGIGMYIPGRGNRIHSIVQGGGSKCIVRGGGFANMSNIFVKASIKKSPRRQNIPLERFLICRTGLYGRMDTWGLSYTEQVYKGGWILGVYHLQNRYIREDGYLGFIIYRTGIFSFIYRTGILHPIYKTNLAGMLDK